MDKENNILGAQNDTVKLSVPIGLENSDPKDIIDYLFENGNRLLTATGAEFELPRDTQGIVAYFSGGEIIVSRTHQYDGRVLAFIDLLKKRGRVVREPFYSDLGLISGIYKMYEATLGGVHRSRQDYDNQMQKDFVDIIARAAAQKVSDVHIEVADQTTIYFRIDGSMQPVLEYNSGWGESFVRAAFASADMSNANYAQNEYQSAQKDGGHRCVGPKIYICRRGFWVFVCNLIRLHLGRAMWLCDCCMITRLRGLKPNKNLAHMNSVYWRVCVLSRRGWLLLRGQPVLVNQQRWCAICQ